MASAAGAETQYLHSNSHTLSLQQAHIHTNTHTRVRTHTNLQQAHSHTRACKHTHTHTHTHTQLHSHTGHTNAALLEVLLYFIKSLFKQSEIILDENSKHTQSHIRVTHILWYVSFWSFYFHSTRLNTVFLLLCRQPFVSHC